MTTTYFPNGSVYDDFRAVTPATLIGRVSQSGHTWVNMSGSGTWDIVDDTPNGAAEGNVAMCNVLNNGRAGIDFGTADVSVETVLHLPDPDIAPDGAPSGSAGLFFRGTLTTQYSLVYFAGSVYLSSPTADLANWVVGPIVDGDYIGVVAAGSSISAYWNGALLGSVTDSSSTGTVHGLYNRFHGPSEIKFYAFNMHPERAGWIVGAVSL